MKVRVVVLIMLLVCLTVPVHIVNGSNERFSDVPLGHWADQYVHKLKALGITKGKNSNAFGIGETLSKSEFIAFLVRLMDWEIDEPEEGSFRDNKDKTAWFYGYIETAIKQGVIEPSEDFFFPSEPITREEMAIMIVRTLGYEGLAQQFKEMTSSFKDVDRNIGYIKIAEEIGIVKGVGDSLFNPYGTAKREEAAAILIRMADKLNKPIQELHGFYSYRSHHQQDIVTQFDSVSYDLGLLKYDETKDSYYLDVKDYDTIKERRLNHEQEKYFMVTSIWNEKVATQLEAIGVLEYFLQENKYWTSITEELVQVTKNLEFDGIVIDFEQLKGEETKSAFNLFLLQLKEALELNNQRLLVAVHPSQSSYNGYDYKVIGEIADKIILMAHDYNAKKLSSAYRNQGYTTTPLTPIHEIYEALKSITDEASGVLDKEKIMLQISFDSVQWEVDDGVVINENAWRPTYDKIYNRLIKDGTSIHFNKTYQNPCAVYTNEDTGVKNVIWYENTQSVLEKLKVAKMFDIHRISLWKIGNIPDYNNHNEVDLDIWEQLKALRIE